MPLPRLPKKCSHQPTENEAQGMVDAAIASARAQLANITFSYDEITIPHGFDTTPGALGSHQTITVPANSSNAYKMQNDEWSVKVSIDKIDSETKQQIHGDAEFAIFSSGILFCNGISPLAGITSTRLSVRAMAPTRSSTTAAMQTARIMFTFYPAQRGPFCHCRAPRSQRVLRRLDGCSQSRHGWFRVGQTRLRL